MDKLNNTNIKQHYGPHVLREISEHESISGKLDRCRSHLYFTLHCKHANLTPKSLKVKCGSAPDNGKTRKIVNNAERALISNRIGELVSKRSFLTKKKDTLSDKLKNTISSALHRKISESRNINIQKQKR